MEESQATSREVVRVLAALSDENRFRIVELLAEQQDELSCGSIGKALDLSPSLLSHHLAILADAGIIGRRKNGLWTMNALKRSVIEQQLEVLDGLIGRSENGSEPAVTYQGLDNGASPADADAPGPQPPTA